MSKYNDILRKHKIMSSVMNIAIWTGLISAVVYFLYMLMTYGLSEKTTPSIFISIGIFISISLTTRIIFRMKYGKMSNLIMYDHKAIKKSIDYLLNGISYNKTIKHIDKYLDKFSDEDFSKKDMMQVILESHYGDSRQDVISHVSIMRIVEKIKNL